MILLLWLACIFIGAFAASISGYFGNELANAAILGGLLGGTLGIIGSRIFREPHESTAGSALLATIPYCGFISGFTAALFFHAGYLGGFLACGLGWVTGLTLGGVLGNAMNSNRSE